MPEMIRLDQVSKIYNNEGSSSIGIQNVTASFSLGEFVAITGESGSGKSTFLNVVSLLDSYEEGELFIDGKSTAEFTKEDFAKYQANYVSFVFQEYNIIEAFDCLSNVMLPLLAKGVSYKEAKERALKALDEVGLKKNAHQRTSKLSGGQKQRVVIARALVSDTPVLACDEPTGNLDSKTGKEIIDLFKKVSQNKLVFFVTHDYDQVKDVATRHLVIKDGHIIQDEKLRESPIVDAKPIPKKENTNFWHRLLLGWKDVICTPKKSLLSFIIALLISLGGLGIAYSSYSMFSSYSSMVTTTVRQYSYSMTAANRVLAFDRDKGDTPLADYVFPTEAYVDYGNSITNIDYFYAVDRVNDPNNQKYQSWGNGGIFYDDYTLVMGRAPTASDEAVVLFPENNADAYIKRIGENTLMGNTFTINPLSPNGDIAQLDLPVKIVGCYKTNWLSRPTNNCIAFSLEAYRSLGKTFDSYITASTLSVANLSATGVSLLNPENVYQDISFSMKGIEVSNNLNVYSFTGSGIDLHKIYVTSALEGQELTVTYQNSSFVISADKLTVLSDDRASTTRLACSYPALYEHMVKEAPVASVYFSSKGKAKTVSNELLTNKIDAKTADIPSYSKTTTNYLAIIFIILFIGLFALLGLLLAFIGALIFRIIYASKRKDYAVFTTLSFSMGDVRWINFVEIFLYFLAGSLVSFFTFFILGNTISDADFLLVIAPLLNMYSSPLAICIYFLSIIAYSFLISFWTMKKLYKKTRAENLRKDDSLL